MGLAAVPFGTAQAMDYEIKVTSWYTCNPNDPKGEKDGAMHFKISVKPACEGRYAAEIVWPVNQDHPNPIRIPGSFVQGSVQYRRKGNDLYFEFYPPRETKPSLENSDNGYDQIAARGVAALMDKRNWAEFYDPKEFSDEEINRVFQVCDVLVDDPYGCKHEVMSLFRVYHIREILKSFHEGKDEEASKIYFGRYDKVYRMNSVFGSVKCPNLEELYKKQGLNYKRCKGSFYHKFDGCTCVCYCCGANFLFYLIRDPKHVLSDSEYKLIIEIQGRAEDKRNKDGEVAFGGEATYVWVKSEVPTCCCGIFKGLYSDNEIMNEDFRENLIEQSEIGVCATDRFGNDRSEGSFFASPGISDGDKKERKGLPRRYQFVVAVDDTEEIHDVMLDNCHSLKYGEDRKKYGKRLERFFEKQRRVRNLKELKEHIKELSALINEKK